MENKSKLPGLAEENRYNGTADPFLVQVQLITEEIREGMSYIFRLADGSFLLIDGGWPEKIMRRRISYTEYWSNMPTGKSS